ncbi:MAG: hypothetical protein JRJ85_02550 [Deltaproteobacteria bacterium]|nr:hypothetical protein [Deltaproteobacteria bacterium]
MEKRIKYVDCKLCGKLILVEILSGLCVDCYNGIYITKEIKSQMTDSKKLAIAIKALKTIRDSQGKVCEQYELCNHPSCKSSYASYAIADKALIVIN